MSPPRRSTHDLLWHSRLQDWLDDRLTACERTGLEQHLTGCSRCRDWQDDLRRVDAALSASIGRPSLDESFDQRLLALVDAQAVT